MHNLFTSMIVYYHAKQELPDWDIAVQENLPPGVPDAQFHPNLNARSLFIEIQHDQSDRYRNLVKDFISEELAPTLR